MQTRIRSIQVNQPAGCGLRAAGCGLRLLATASFALLIGSLAPHSLAWAQGGHDNCVVTDEEVATIEEYIATLPLDPLTGPKDWIPAEYSWDNVLDSNGQLVSYVGPSTKSPYHCFLFSEVNALQVRHARQAFRWGYLEPSSRQRGIWLNPHVWYDCAERMDMPGYQLYVVDDYGIYFSPLPFGAQLSVARWIHEQWSEHIGYVESCIQWPISSDWWPDNGLGYKNSKHSCGVCDRYRQFAPADLPNWGTCSWIQSQHPDETLLYRHNGLVRLDLSAYRDSGGHVTNGTGMLNALAEALILRGPLRVSFKCNRRFSRQGSTNDMEAGQPVQWPRMVVDPAYDCGGGHWISLIGYEKQDPDYPDEANPSVPGFPSVTFQDMGAHGAKNIYKLPFREFAAPSLAGGAGGFDFVLAFSPDDPAGVPPPYPIAVGDPPPDPDVIPLRCDIDADGWDGYSSNFALDNCPYLANPAQQDYDGDGAGDGCDNCPNIPNASQRDSDMDGLGDACDLCPENPAPQQDDDGDGVGNDCDNCPDVPNHSQADADGDGVGDVCDNCPHTPNHSQYDSDFDGVGLECDNCPWTANPDQADWNGDGVGDACQDTDADGVIDLYDCEPGSGMLAYDLDSDGVCEPEPGFQQPACELQCSVTYGSFGLDPTACLARCASKDNCPCREAATCPTSDLYQQYLEGYFQQHCVTHKSCIDSGEADCGTRTSADLCHAFFANPDQADTNRNNVGDRCESTPRGRIAAFYPDRIAHHSKGHVCISHAQQYFVDVAMEGGTTSARHSRVIYGPIHQRTSVGACGCTAKEIEEGSCDTREFCPTGEEYNSLGLLAWEAIQSDEANQLVNVGEAPDACPTCPLTLDVDREPNWLTQPLKYHQYAINKHLGFSHNPSQHTKTLTWPWKNPVYAYTSRPLSNLSVRTRVAWQDPAETHYVYRAPPNPNDHLLGYSDRTVMEAWGSCTSVPWELCIGPGCPMPRMLTRPWTHTDPSPVDFGPWAWVRDAQTSDIYQIDYGRRSMQPADIARLSFTEGQAPLPGALGPAMTAAVLDTKLLGLDLSVAPVIFQYGGTLGDGGGSGTFWVGLPTDPERRWLRAEKIWGAAAAQGPKMFDGAILVFDEKGRRLVLLGGHQVFSEDYPEYRNELWTFDLVRGLWKRISGLPEDFSTAFMTPAEDRLRGRVLLVGAVPTDSAKVFQLDLRTLGLKELAITATGEEPGKLWGAGAFLEPFEQALYLYGGLSEKDYSTVAYRLDLISREWSRLGDGKQGPGSRLNPFVSFDRTTGTVWVAGGEYGPEEEGLPLWGLRGGEWVRRDSLLPEPDQAATFTTTYDPYARIQVPLVAPDTTPYPGTLFLATLISTDPSLGLQVLDSSGEVVTADLSPSPVNTVSFFAHSMYTVQVVPLPGLAPDARPELTITIAPANLQEVGGYHDSAGVNDLLVQDDVAYLVGESGLEAVDLTDLGSPRRVGQLALGGTGMAISACGEMSCVSKSPQGGSSLLAVDLSSPTAPRTAAALTTPGQSRSIGVKAGSWVYLADGGAGVSILDARDPASPVRVDHLSLPGQVTSLVVSANRLYVATRPDLLVRIYELTEEESPALLGELTTGNVVEAMRVHGNTLHVAEHAGNDWQGCMTGRHCPRGSQAEVYDVSDPSSPALVGEYDSQAFPAVHLVPYRDHALVRTFDGFTIYQAVPVP